MGEIEQIYSEAQMIGHGSSKIVCPFCSHERRKKNLRDMTVTIQGDDVLYYCHHCSASDVIRKNKKEEEVTIMTPAKIEDYDLSKPLGQWLNSRKISMKTAVDAGCKETLSYFQRLGKESPAICFPYRNKGNAYAYKIRSYPDKDFTCKGSPQTMFNGDNVDWESIVIVEGEMDVLSCLQAGVKDVVSVPHGAFKLSGKGNGSDARLRFLKNHTKDLKDTKKIVIFTDADESGETMGAELARRLGRDRCWQVSLPEGCKDANDILVKHGEKALREVIDSAEPWPLEGLHDASHYEDKVMDIWAKGLGRGETTGLRDLDEIYSVLPGQMTVVTGHPSNGKSELVDQLMTHLAETKGWKFAICSFENPPHLHIAKLVAKYIGMPFFNSETGRMSETQRDAGLKFVQEHFSFLYNSDGNLTTLDSIFERMKAAVLRHGIRGIVIDPYNYIAKAGDQTETDWISVMLSRVRQFAQAHDVHVWFVAHPTKMSRSADGTIGVPKGGDISGSAAWWAKADMGMTVHRPDPGLSNTTEVHIWKVRYGWTGAQGKAEMYFNDYANRFVTLGEVSEPKRF